MTRINPHLIDSFYFEEEHEVELWKNSIFVFDTSALLQFYYYSDNAKKNIFETIFETLKGRLWIPSHVEFEYLKNRESTIRKSYSEKYDPLEKDNLKGVQSIIDSITPKIDDFQIKTKSTETHPFINSQIIDDFKIELEKFRNAFQEFDRRSRQEFEKRKAEIDSMLSSDTVLKAMGKYFTVGKPYDFGKLMDVIAEGEVRYRNTIPPGYKDVSGKEGMQKYGDLIIWKQILDQAEEIKKPIVLIINDVKDDWAYRQDKERRIDRPREELVKEIQDRAHVAFWMYTFSQFLYTAKTQLNAPIDNKVLEEVEQVGIKQFNLEKVGSPLSSREMEVLRLITRGLSNKEIASSLGISHQTVKNHVTSILRKFEVEDRTQAVVFALQNGWTRLQALEDLEEEDDEE